jgi:hypothetical protein
VVYPSEWIVWNPAGGNKIFANGNEWAFEIGTRERLSNPDAPIRGFVGIYTWDEERFEVNRTSII